MVDALCHPDDLAGVGISSGFITANSLYVIRMTYSSILCHSDDCAKLDISSG